MLVYNKQFIISRYEHKCNNGMSWVCGMFGEGQLHTGLFRGNLMGGEWAEMEE